MKALRNLLVVTVLTGFLIWTASVSAGSVEGIVTSQSTGQPLSAGFVRIHNSSGTQLGLASIGNNGAYSYGGLAAGTYFARTTSTNYFDELWNDIPCAQGACVVTSGTAIVVGASSVTANFALAAGGSIGGTVTSTSSGQPVTTGFVRIHNSSGTQLGLASIGSNGAYSYGGLAAGTYFARTTSTNHLDELWNDIPCAQGACAVTSGTPIVVTSGTVVANFALSAQGTITGTVTSVGSGLPITTGFVRIHNSSGTQLGLASIGSNGAYSYGGLDAGTYFARTTSTNHLDELWNDIPCAQGACVVTSGTAIVVGASTVTANFALATGGSIAGSVTSSSSGLPITTGFVRIHDSSGTQLGLASIGNDGNFVYGGLAAGSYYARTTSTGALDELWENISCAQGACTVTSGTAIPVQSSGSTVANFQLGDSLGDMLFADGFESGLILQNATNRCYTGQIQTEGEDAYLAVAWAPFPELLVARCSHPVPE